MPEKRPDYFTEAGAHMLAKKIRNYWIMAGFPKVAVEVVPVQLRRYDTVYTLKSNIGISGPPF